jgi:hypothetical protein
MSLTRTFTIYRCPEAGCKYMTTRLLMLDEHLKRTHHLPAVDVTPEILTYTPREP